MGTVTVNRLDHIQDLEDVLALASFARGPVSAVWEEFDNSLDDLSLSTDTEWAIATALARSVFERHKGSIELQMTRDDCPKYGRDDTDTPLLFVMTGKRELMAMLETMNKEGN